jgi:hypothetical protein
LLIRLIRVGGAGAPPPPTEVNEDVS